MYNLSLSLPNLKQNPLFYVCLLYNSGGGVGKVHEIRIISSYIGNYFTTGVKNNNLHNLIFLHPEWNIIRIVQHWTRSQAADHITFLKFKNYSREEKIWLSVHQGVMYVTYRMTPIFIFHFFQNCNILLETTKIN